MMDGNFDPLVSGYGSLATPNGIFNLLTLCLAYWILDQLLHNPLGLANPRLGLDLNHFGQWLL